MVKRLVFSTETPNDQGGIVPNDSFVWDRYLKNPVLLSDHCWWTGTVLGIMTDVKLVSGKWSGIPIFHEQTQLSREAKGMYEAGALNAASVGGEAVWKSSDVSGDFVRNKEGFKVCEKFYLYEISLLPLPSNMDAVGEKGEEETNLSAYKIKFYEPGFAKTNEGVIEKLSSHFNLQNMYIPKSPIMRDADPGEAGAGGTGGGAGTPPAKKPSQTAPKPESEPVTLGAAATADDLPPVIKAAIKNGYSVTFSSAALAAPAPKGEPSSKLPGENVDAETQPDPIGLKAQAAVKAFRALQKANEKADTSLKALQKAKKEMDEAEDGDEEMGAKKTTYEAAKLSAEKACLESEKKEEEYKAAQDEADEEEKTSKEKKGSGAKRTSMASGYNMPVVAPAKQPEMKTAEQLKSELQLATKPSFKATVGAAAQGVTFTKLNAANADENTKNILKRVFHKGGTPAQTNIQDHAIVLNAMLNDRRLAPVVQKVRLMADVSDNQAADMRKHPQSQRGQTLTDLAADFNAGRVQYRNRAGQLDNLTMLTSTDDALASPALNTIEWLSLAIFELFPTTSWKANIPMFGATITSRNTGIILANIVAEPAIYKGNSPAPAADYTYTDQAVALSLTPYWLQPILWNPLYMHQLRYDQMSTGWAQSFAKWNAVIDDNLLYTLASTTPGVAGAVVPTSGLSGYQNVPLQFNIPASGAQNKFYWNPNFAGNLNYPVLNDIIGVEQVYRNQNFELEREKSVLVIDPIMERYLATDPETKSLLTRWIDSNGEEFKGFKHTMLDVRSRVAVYDPATGQVKDINGAIPATSVSAGVGFIPSQVGIGIGLLDVFMIQDPANYGYRMSADIRIGIVPLRRNFYGNTLLVYGSGNPV